MEEGSIYSAVSETVSDFESDSYEGTSDEIKEDFRCSLVSSTMREDIVFHAQFLQQKQYKMKCGVKWQISRTSTNVMKILLQY